MFDKVIEEAEFYATKFVNNHQRWVYTEDLGDLEHIRFKSDYTGRNHWLRRLGRALNFKRTLAWEKPLRGKLSLRKVPASLYWNFVASMRKDNNLPDGRINTNFFSWEEDGKYFALFQPLVGMKVLEFCKDNPDNPYAQAILEEMLQSKNAYDAARKESNG